MTGPRRGLRVDREGVRLHQAEDLRAGVLRVLHGGAHRAHREDVAAVGQVLAGWNVARGARHVARVESPSRPRRRHWTVSSPVTVNDGRRVLTNAAAFVDVRGREADVEQAAGAQRLGRVEQGGVVEHVDHAVGADAEAADHGVALEPPDSRAAGQRAEPVHDVGAERRALGGAHVQVVALEVVDQRAGRGRAARAGRSTRGAPPAGSTALGTSCVMPVSSMM